VKKKRNNPHPSADVGREISDILAERGE
jgi:hypothetical protein